MSGEHDRALAGAAQRLLVDGWLVDVPGHRMTREGVARRLEPKAMQVLECLVERPGEVVTRRELLDRIWVGVIVGDDAVSAAVIKLRRAFGDDARAPRVIQTVPKSGYRLLAPVERVAAPAAIDETRDEMSAHRAPSIRPATVLRCVLEMRAGGDEPLEPERWREAFRAALVRVAEIMRRNGGHAVLESAAVVGVFGAPAAQEHHATRAVTAAMAIRAAFTAAVHGDGTPAGDASTPFRIAARLGLASGEVASTTPGTEEGADVYGAPVQIAHALARAARAGEVLLGAETHRLAEGLRGVHPCSPPPALVGQNDEVFVLEPSGGWIGVFEARRNRGLSPLVGREREMAEIGRLLEQAAAGQGRLVALAGDPGAGKSRLAHETLHLAAGHGFAIRTGASSPLERHTPFHALRPMFADVLGIDAGTPVEVDRALAAAGVADVLERAALMSILDPRQCPEAWQRLDPAERRQRAAAAFERIVFGGAANARPVLVLVEDLHWMDDASHALLDHLVRRIARLRCLVLITYRTEFEDPWSTRSHHTRVRVEPLAPAQAACLLERLVGGDSSLARWKANVVERSGGMPLFLEESVRTAETAGALSGAPGNCRLADDASGDAIPASVHALLAERIDRLPAPARNVLSLAAVAGAEVPAALLRALLSPQEMAQIESLRTAELLFETTGRGEPVHVFRHALVQEVAYRGIAPSARRALHRRIAETLDSELAPRAPERVARHYAGAGMPAAAVAAWLRAAQASMAAASFSDALGHLAQAARVLPDIADRDERDRQALCVELGRGVALVQHLGPAAAEVEQAYARARALAHQCGAERERFEAVWGLWFVHMMRGDMRVERRLADDLLTLAEGLGDEALLLEAHHVQWSGLSLVGRPGAVHEYASTGIERYRADDHHWLTFSYGGHDPGVCARNIDAMALWLLGFADRARTRAGEAIALAEELGHPYSCLESVNSALNIALFEEDTPALLRHTDALHALVDEERLPEVAAGYANGFRGAALALRGELESGLELMLAAAPLWQEFWGAWCYPLDTVLAALLARTGDADAGIAHLEHTLELADHGGAHWWDAELLRTRAEIRLAGPAVAEQAAATDLERALDIAREQQSLFLELRVATSNAQRLRARGQAATARTLLGTVCTRFAETQDSVALRRARTLLAELE